MAETLILPAAVDLHAHLREPSTNESENIASGTYAALMGGFGFVADMPNNPGNPTWTHERLLDKQQRAFASALVRVAFYAGSQPESDNLGELEGMATDAIGIKFYGDKTTGNDATYDALDFVPAAREWHRVAPEKPIMFHAGPDNLWDMIGYVAGDLGHALHVCHVNDPDQVDMVNVAKERGWQVTAGVTPHHLLMTSHDRSTRGTLAEMMPPLAHQVDAELLMDRLQTGEIDVIETDFAPHSIDAKLEAERSGGHCFGVPGIEHVIPLLLYQALKQETLSMTRLKQAIFYNPADILNLKLKASKTSATWDIEEGPYMITPESVRAQCGWTPYLGMLAIGKLQDMSINGRRVFYKGMSLASGPGRIVFPGEREDS